MKPNPLNENIFPPTSISLVTCKEDAVVAARVVVPSMSKSPVTVKLSLTVVSEVV